MKLIPLFFFLLLSVMNVLGQQKQFSLTELKSLAVNQFETIRINRLAVQQAKRATAIASTSRLPRVDLSASYNHVSKTGSIDFVIPGVLSRSISFGDGNIYDAGILASVPLFTGSKIGTSIELSELQEQAATVTLDASIIDVCNAVTIQFKLAQLALKQESILAQQERLLEENIAQRRQYLEQGQVLAFDTLVLSTRKSQLKVEQASAESLLQQALLTLKQLTGHKEDFEVSASEMGHAETERLGIDELMRHALEKRSDMRILDISRQASEKGVIAAQGNYYPSIYAMAALRYGRPGVDQIANVWMEYWTAGVKLEWNLWSWNADKYAVEKQEYEVEKIQLKEVQLKNQIRTQLETTLNEIDVRKKMLALLDDQIRQEQEKQALVQARFQEGMATSMELVDAETSLTSAMLRKEQTAIEYSLKVVELSAAIGLEY